MDTVNLPFPALSPSSRSTVIKHTCLSLLRVRTIKSLCFYFYTVISKNQTIFSFCFYFLTVISKDQILFSD